MLMGLCTDEDAPEEKLKDAMNKRFPLLQVNPINRSGYLWLALGTLLSLFATNGRWDFSLAAWLSPLFLLRFTRTRSLSSGFVGVWLASFISMLFWLYESNFYDPRIFSIANIFILAIFLISHTILVVPYLLDRLLEPRLSLVSGLLATLIFPLGCVACEYINALFVPYGSFFSLGYTQYGNLPLLQVVAITGVYGVNFLVAWFASVSNWIWEQHFVWPRIRATVLLYSGVLVLTLLGGSIRLAFFAPSVQTIRVAGVSAPRAVYQRAMQSIESASHPDRSLMRAAFTSIENELLNASQREARDGAKIVSWPEIEASTLPEDEALLIERGKTLAQQEHFYLEMTYRVVQQDDTPIHNRAVLIDPEGHVVWTYDKAHPAPGADPSIPGDGIIPVVDTPYGRLASVICLDAWYPGLMHQGGNKGIDVMIVPSEEWVGSSGGSLVWPTQETTFRAIEYGYSLVRQASGDVAMTVDYQGHVLAATDYYTTDQQTMVAYVPVKGVWTIYGLIGDLFSWLCIAGLFVLAMFAVIILRRNTLRALAPVPELSVVSTEEKHAVGVGKSSV